MPWAGSARLHFFQIAGQRNRAIFGYSDDEDDFLDDVPSRSGPDAPPRHLSGMDEAAKAYEARRSAAAAEDAVLAQRVAASKAMEEKPTKKAQLPACFQGSDDEDEEDEDEDQPGVDEELTGGHATVDDFNLAATGRVSYANPVPYKGDEPVRGTDKPTWGAGEEVEPGQRKVVFDPRWPAHTVDPGTV